MIFVLLSILGLSAGFAGLAWGWRENHREADDRRESRQFVYDLFRSEALNYDVEAELSSLPARIALYNAELRLGAARVRLALLRLSEAAAFTSPK